MTLLNAERFTTFETALGRCAIAWNDQGIACLQLPTQQDDDIRRWHDRRVPRAVQATPEAGIASTIEAAVNYFNGARIDFSEVPVDLGRETQFFVRVYKALRQVEYGHATTYGTLAKQLGMGPEMARDIGVAMATNPVPLIIPCHRVLAAGSKIGGFSAPGGTSTKRLMLQLEGIEIAEPKPVKPAGPTQQAFDF